ncbi:MAG TPA: GNAT family N-acetyltransferase [Negativicutes bacterium]|jgi:ribosomal-protein-alanine N-acetyltransferase
MIELVRKIEPELIQRLVQLEKEAFGEGGMNAWHLVPLIRHGRVYVLKKDLEFIGLLQYMLDWDSPPKAYLIGVSISQKFRGQGLGTELLKNSLEILFRENIEEVELTVDPNNVGAVKIYESKLGFKITDSRKNEYGKSEDRLVMKLSSADFANQDVT